MLAVIVALWAPPVAANTGAADPAAGPSGPNALRQLLEQRTVVCGASAPLAHEEMFATAMGGPVPGPARDAFDLVVSQLAGGQPVERAAAILLSSSADVHRSTLRCGFGDDECLSRRNALLGGARAQVARRLAELSATTDDPDVWAVAFRACHSPPPVDGSAPRAAVPDEPRCAAVTAEAWARRDPGNAAPWIEAAGVSARRGDAGRVDERLGQAAQGAFVDHREGGLARALAHPVFGPPASLALWIGVANLDKPERGLAWQGSAADGAVADWCGRRAASAEGLAQCRALLLLVLTRNRSSDDAAQWAMAISMGLPGRVQPLTPADQARAFDSFMWLTPAWNDIEKRLPEGYGCDALQARRDLLVRAARVGQAQVVADWLKAHPGWRPRR